MGNYVQNFLSSKTDYNTLHMKKLLILILLSFAINASGQKIFDHIKNGDLKKVQKWLDSGEGLNDKVWRENDEGSKSHLHPLEIAGYFNQKEILDLFIENRSRFNFFDEWISDALASSIHNCDIETVEKLIDAGATVDNLCNTCRQAPPIAIAITYECDEIYNLLLSKNAYVYNEDAGYDVIHAAAGNFPLDSLKILIENFELNPCQEAKKSGVSGAYFAAQNGNLENLQYFIDSGCGYGKLDSEGYSILNYASNLETFKFLETLISGDGLLSKMELEKGTTPLIFSIISHDDKELFDYFLERYPKYIDYKIDGNRTLDQLLFIEENTDYFLNQLLERGLNLYSKDKYGKTLTFYAKKMKRKNLLDAIKAYEKSH